MINFKFIRLLILIGLALFFYVYVDAIIWCLFVLLFIFYASVDFFHVDKAPMNNFDISVEYEKHQDGIIGRYHWDETDWYGLFITLNNKKIFIDIKEDEFIDDRLEYAKLLLANKSTLEKSLLKFYSHNLKFKNKNIDGIGLYSKKMKQGEVSWDFEGYTLLKEYDFLNDDESA